MDRDLAQILSRALGPLHADGEWTRAEVDASALEALCEGHFPGFLLVPGSHLVALMFELVRVIHPDVARERATFRRALFRAPVHPTTACVVRARARTGGPSGARFDVEILAGSELAASCVVTA